jgi:hypothetical protein
MNRCAHAPLRTPDLAANALADAFANAAANARDRTIFKAMESLA